MVEILKNLDPSELANVLIVLGLARELRIILKIVLSYKLQKDKK